MEDDDSDSFCLNPRRLFHSDQSSQSNSQSSGAIVSGSEHTDSPTNYEDGDSDFGTFDWQEAVPGNGWTPQSLARSSQGSIASTPSCSSSSHRKPARGSPDSLGVPSIEAALGAQCRCRMDIQGKNCMSHFNIGDVFRLRHTRSKMTATEIIAQRHSDLNRALEVACLSGNCRILVNGHSICLQAYCMLFNINLASMRRTWRNLSMGIYGHQGMGRPRGSSGGVISSVRGMQAYAWLKTWMEVSADQDPVGQHYKYTINFILPSDLYEEYHADFVTNKVEIAETALSGRAFARVWSHFKKVEQVRVRRKANTTTKCSGKPTVSSSVAVLVFVEKSEVVSSTMNGYWTCSLQSVTNFGQALWTPLSHGRSERKSIKLELNTARTYKPCGSCMSAIHRGPRSIVPFRPSPLMAQTPTLAIVLKVGEQR